LVGSFDDLNLPINSFDVVVLNFAHFFHSAFANFHKQCVGLLKKSGYLILEGFSKEHFELN
jgi:hypothetical protein